MPGHGSINWPQGQNLGGEAAARVSASAVIPGPEEDLGFANQELWQCKPAGMGCTQPPSLESFGYLKHFKIRAWC